MREGVFVTGTGTGVGKTVVAAVIARQRAALGERVAVFKPAVTGLDEDGEPDHHLLRRAAGSEQSDGEIAPYRYGPAVSPHLAAKLAGEQIEPQRLIAAAHAAASGADFLVCEGVGGFLVPLTDKRPFRANYLIRDLARDLDLPVIVAANWGLGTINHTLLTIEAVRGAGLSLRGVVMSGFPGTPSRMEHDNLRQISKLGGAGVTAFPELDLSRPQTWVVGDLA